MNYLLPGRKLVTCLIIAVFLAGMFSAQAADSDYEIGTWANFCEGAISHTFDDNKNTNPEGEGQKVFDDKNFHISLCVQTGSVNWENCKTSFAKGHEISSHTVNHQSSNSEFEQSQNAIRQNVPGEKCVTVAYPNCQQNGANTLNYFLAGRNCDGKINAATPQNWEQVGSQMFGSPRYGNSANDLNSYANQAASANGWAVYTHHGIGGDSHSWATTDINAMKGHIEYLDQNRDKIWCETFGNVARYIQEREAAQRKELSADDNSFTFEITDDLDDEIFDYPLTVRRPMPDDWDADNIVVTQGDDTMETKVIDNFIQFQAIPDGGEVLISSGKTATRQGMGTNSLLPAEIIGYANNKLQISTAPFPGNTISVSVFNLSGKLLYRNTVHAEGGKSAVVDVGGAIGKTAFIVTASNGTISHMRRLIP